MDGVSNSSDSSLNSLQNQSGNQNQTNFDTSSSVKRHVPDEVNRENQRSLDDFSVSACNNCNNYCQKRATRNITIYGVLLSIVGSAGLIGSVGSIAPVFLSALSPITTAILILILLIAMVSSCVTMINGINLIGYSLLPQSNWPNNVDYTNKLSKIIENILNLDRTIADELQEESEQLTKNIQNITLQRESATLDWFKVLFKVQNGCLTSGEQVYLKQLQFISEKLFSTMHAGLSKELTENSRKCITKLMNIYINQVLNNNNIIHHMHEVDDKTKKKIVEHIQEGAKQGLKKAVDLYSE